MLLIAWTLSHPSGASHAQDQVPVDSMGKFLGHTVMCGCLPYEDDHLLALYFALLVEWEDSSYADAASGYMELARDGDYRNEATFCSIICDHEFTVYLTDVITVIDLETEPEEFIVRYNYYRDRHGSGDAGTESSGEGLNESDPVWPTGHRS